VVGRENAILVINVVHATWKKAAVIVLCRTSFLCRKLRRTSVCVLCRTSLCVPGQDTSEHQSPQRLLQPTERRHAAPQELQQQIKHGQEEEELQQPDSSKQSLNLPGNPTETTSGRMSTAERTLCLLSATVAAKPMQLPQRWARIRTEANFGRIRTGLDWEIFCRSNVIIPTISNFLVVIRFYRFDKSCKSQKRQSLLELFCLQPIVFGSRQNSSSSAFAAWSKIDTAQKYMVIHGRIRTGSDWYNFQNICRSRLDRIQFFQIRIGLGLKIFTACSSLSCSTLPAMALPYIDSNVPFSDITPSMINWNSIVANQPAVLFECLVEPKQKRANRIQQENFCFNFLKKMFYFSGAKLWEQLVAARESRRQAEKQRQELVKQAKTTTSKMNQKRIAGALFLLTLCMPLIVEKISVIVTSQPLPAMRLNMFASLSRPWGVWRFVCFCYLC